MDFGPILQTVTTTLILYSVPVLFVLLGTLIVRSLLRKGLEAAESMIITKIQKEEAAAEREKRVRTLFDFARGATTIVLYVVAALVFLNTIDVEIGPVLAAAGVLGLAVSFGSQELVRDIISGTFILFENHVRMGDVVMVNGQGGVVEDITLRNVILRDLSGTLHVFRNGSITTIANMTKGWSAAVLDVGVAYKEDVDKVITVMKEVATDLKSSDEFGPKMIADAEVFGLDSFGDSSVNIKMRLKTKPADQWVVGREYRRRLKQAFDHQNIEIPFPHTSLYFGEASEPIRIMMKQMAEAE